MQCLGRGIVPRVAVQRHLELPLLPVPVAFRQEMAVSRVIPIEIEHIFVNLHSDALVGALHVIIAIKPDALFRKLRDQDHMIPASGLVYKNHISVTDFLPVYPPEPGYHVHPTVLRYPDSLPAIGLHHGNGHRGILSPRSQT